MDVDPEWRSQEPPRHLLPLFLSVALGVVLVLLVWNRVAASPRLCASCHSMDQAVSTAARSVHQDISCLACHGRPGLLGSLRYVPTLMREGVATVTGWDVAGDVLHPAGCGSCHADVATSPALEGAHAEQATDCASCHGDVAHPSPEVVRRVPPGEDPHPQGFAQVHGGEYVAGPSCATCHSVSFCQACHFRSNFPHAKGWIQDHGEAQRLDGADSCALCHPSTFCAGCHGTEIPHRADWLDEHWRSLQDAAVSPCLVCHPPTDCTTCHSEHGIHREQDLYAWGSP